MITGLIAFDYAKYAADPKAWVLYDGLGGVVVAVFKSNESEGGYPLKGIVKFMHKEGEVGYNERAWTLEGMYLRDHPDSNLNITQMGYVKVEKPAQQRVKYHVPIKLRNLYYDAENNRLSMSMITYENYEDAYKVALKEVASNPKKEHMCVFSMLDHPQIKELLIAKGLAEVVIEYD